LLIKVLICYISKYNWWKSISNCGELKTSDILEVIPKSKKTRKKWFDKIWFRYFLWFCVFLLISVPSIAPPEAHEGQNAPDGQRDRRRNQLLRFFVRNWWNDLNKSNIHCKYFLHRWKNLNVPKRIQFIQMSKYKVCF
jgi:hypothetical protein